MFKKIVSITITLTMMFSCLGVNADSVNVQTSDEVKCIFIDDCEAVLETDNNYHDKIIQAIEKNGLKTKSVNVAKDGMRLEDLHYILDDGYAGDKEVVNNAAKLQVMRSNVSAELPGASLICMRLGISNFANCLNNLNFDNGISVDFSPLKYDQNNPSIETLISDTKSYYREKIDNILSQAIENAHVDAALAKSLIKALIPDGQYDAYLSGMSDVLSYAYLGFCVNFDESIKHIREKNSSAKIVMETVASPFEGLVIQYTIAGSTVEVPLGELFDECIIQKVNKYIKDESPYRSEYTVIDFTNNEVETYFDALQNADTSNITPEVTKCLAYYDEMLDAETILKKTAGTKYKQEILSEANKKLLEVLKETASNKIIDIDDFAEEDVQERISPAKAMKDLEEDLKEILVNVAKGREKTAATKAKHIYRDVNYKAVLACMYRNGNNLVFLSQPTAIGHDTIFEEFNKQFASNTDLEPVAQFDAKETSCKEEGHIAFSQRIFTGKWIEAGYEGEWKDASDLSRFTAKLDHDFQWVTDVKAGCCKDGKKHLECSLCGEKGKSQVISGYGPSTPIIKKVTRDKNSFKVTWQKPSTSKLKYITGYTLKYSQYKTMKNSKTITGISSKTTSKVIKKLASKKRYYVQIRCYKKTSKKTYYSEWSTTKSVVTK